MHYKINVLELTEGWREENPVANLCDQGDNLCLGDSSAFHDFQSSWPKNIEFK